MSIIENFEEPIRRALLIITISQALVLWLLFKFGAATVSPDPQVIVPETKMFYSISAWVFMLIFCAGLAVAITRPRWDTLGAGFAVGMLGLPPLFMDGVGYYMQQRWWVTAFVPILLWRIYEHLDCEPKQEPDDVIA